MSLVDFIMLAIGVFALLQIAGELAGINESLARIAREEYDTE